MFYDAVTENKYSLIFIFWVFSAFLNIKTLVVVYVGSTAISIAISIQNLNLTAISLESLDFIFILW